MLTDNPNAPLILVVEDDNNHATLIQRSFEDAPEEYRLEWVGTLRAAKAATEQYSPSLVLTDYRLPDGDGSELVLKANERWPVIMMTSHGNEQIAVETMKIGVQDYIVKSSEAFEAMPRTVAMALKVWSLIQSRKQAEETLVALKDELKEQNEKLQLNEGLLREQNDQLMATAEMLRVQIDDYQTSQKMLKDSEERFHTLSDASFGGIMIHDKGLILNCNKGLANMTGLTIEELVGMDSFKLVAPECRDLVVQKIQSGFDQRYEVVGLRKDGSTYPLIIIGKNIPYKGRTVRVTEFRDITERKQAEEKRQLLEQQFHQAQKLESLGVLAGGIAHDFNNILTIIMGHCYMAREDMLSELDYKESFKQIETAGNRAADLCRQMLTYAGKSPLTKTQVNLWLLVDEVVKMLQAAIKKNVAIELDMKRDVPEIKGDSGQIQQIVMNLVINASEAIGDNEGTIRIVLTKRVFEPDQTEVDTFGTVIKVDRYACLEVTDTGCGMDEETKKRIFEPFFTTKFTGRGLGMSAISGIIKSHDGILQLTSTPGVGTTFKVYFPLPETSDHADAAPAASTRIEKASGTILLVDDEQTLRVMGTTLLGALGFSAITASNGSEALEIYRERCSEIDVILLDLIMPVMGGIEAHHELRKINQAVPIIICSGYGVESVQDVIENDPNAGFVHKPYKPVELRDVIVKMMKNGRFDR